MSEQVALEREGPIALITLENPPVNALAHPVRQALLAAIVEADEDASIRAIVIHGMGKNFIGGADIREFDGAGPRAPLLNDTLLRVEACTKPVVAALHGAVLGGGLELALSSHYRCATRDVQLGFPEIKLALIPGSGGTQRMPRLIGVKNTLDMMISGEPIKFEQAQELGIIDRTLEATDVEGIRAAALEYARELVAQKAAPRRLRDGKVADAERFDAAFFGNYRKNLPRSARKLAAAERIIQCLEAASNKPFDEALALSRKLFEECRTSTESKALRHLFFAERGSATDKEVIPRQINTVCVIGAGTMGSGIAVSCATSGFKVILIDTQTPALEAGMQRLNSTIDAAVHKGRLNEKDGEAAKARIVARSDLASAQEADLVIEAVFESMAIKQEVFKSLDAVCRPGTVLATNTSTLDIDAIASATQRPADVVGMHFFSPANIMRLVEIVRGRATSAETLATALAVTQRIGKIGVVVGNCFGFVGNRMLYAYGRENQLMLLEGATPQQIDGALEEWGMAMGPNAVGDLAGLDVGYRVRQERRDRIDDPRYYRPADMLASMGRYGQKTGKGFYRYDNESRKREPDPQVESLIRAEAERLDVKQRDISHQEIIERCIYALINEGARILEEGIAACPADIDVIWCNGYGFPRTRGGPMFFADTVGTRVVYEAVRRYEKEQGPQYWTPAQLLRKLAEENRPFTTWVPDTPAQ